METNKKIPKTFIVLLLILLLGLTVFLLSNRQKIEKIQEAPKAPVSVPVVEQPSATATSMRLVGNQSASVGTPIQIVVEGNSGSETIVGFDTLVSYDALAFSYESAKTTLPGFRIFDAKQAGVVSITGVKNAGALGELLSGGTNIVELTFIPQAKGSFAFNLKATTGKETTKFINTETQSFIPSVEGIIVEVR